MLEASDAKHAGLFYHPHFAPKSCVQSSVCKIFAWHLNLRMCMTAPLWSACMHDHIKTFHFLSQNLETMVLLRLPAAGSSQAPQDFLHSLGPPCRPPSLVKTGFPGCPGPPADGRRTALLRERTGPGDLAYTSFELLTPSRASVHAYLCKETLSWTGHTRVSSKADTKRNVNQI